MLCVLEHKVTTRSVHDGAWNGAVSLLTCSTTMRDGDGDGDGQRWTEMVMVMVMMMVMELVMVMDLVMVMEMVIEILLSLQDAFGPRHGGEEFRGHQRT